MRLEQPDVINLPLMGFRVPACKTLRTTGPPTSQKRHTNKVNCSDIPSLLTLLHQLKGIQKGFCLPAFRLTLFLR